MLTSTFIDFSNNISGKTRAIFDLNKKDQDCQIIAKNRGFVAEMLAVPQQIHSSTITYIDTPGDYMATDGLFTDNSDIILTLQVADCVPIFLYESNSHIIGLIHSGWRATTTGIVYNIVSKMCKMGANKKEINIFLGPAIGLCCYEVGVEVANNFNNNAKKKMGRGKWKVGMHEEICIQLTEMGIPSKNIKTSEICTFESPCCHSYRRDGSKAGRMYAFLGLRS